VPPDRVVAFAPGRVNVIGEHTDYNEGLCLPFALARGVTVRAQTIGGAELLVSSRSFGESDRFHVEQPEPAPGWRAFARGVAAELRAGGAAVPAARLEIESNLPVGAGLASSAGLTVALALSLSALAGAPNPDRGGLARLCSRVENEWVGARTGLLDQLAALFGAPAAALLIDCRSHEIETVPLELEGWTLAVISSGAERSLATSSYNERRAECASAVELLGVRSLSDVSPDDLDRLPDPLGRRARHVVEENHRVRAAAEALRARDHEALAGLLNASHASLRDLFEVSVASVEATVERARAAGARGARLMGGGFGGSVLALFAPGVEPPADAIAAEPGPRAWVREA
jgi:galactokinase